MNMMAHYQGVIKNRQRLHIHHAGREVLGRIVLLDEQELGGDGGPRTGLAQLHLEDELVAMRDDRLVLRFYSPVTSIAGGVVLDPRPQRHKRFEDKALEMLDVLESGDPADLFRQNLKEAGFAGLALAESRWASRMTPRRCSIGKRLYHRQLVVDLVGQDRRSGVRLCGQVPPAHGHSQGGSPAQVQVQGRRQRVEPDRDGACRANAPGSVVGDRIGPSAEGPALSAKHDRGPSPRPRTS